MDSLLQLLQRPESRPHEALFIILAVCVAIWVMDGASSKRRAEITFDRLRPMLASQFFQLGYSSTAVGGSGEYRSNGAYEFETYLTGRVHVSYATLKLIFRPRLDLPGWLWDNVFQSMVQAFTGPKENRIDRLKLDIQLYDAHSQRFVCALVDKNLMQDLRSRRFDITFARPVQSTGLPETHTLMTEMPEMSSVLLDERRAIGIPHIHLLEYFIYTDQPEMQPESLEQLKKVQSDASKMPKISISIRLSDSSSSLQETAAKASELLHALLAFGDFLSTPHEFRAEVVQKLTSSREKAHRELKSYLMEVESDVNSANKKKDVSKGAKSSNAKSDDKIRNLSAKEQRKILEKQEKKKIRKAQQANSVRNIR